MDFKFKEVVEESIIYFYDHVLSSNEYTEDVFEELDHVYAQAPKADEYEVKNKELLEELKYLKKVNDDLVWQRDTDEEHESKAKAFDEIKVYMQSAEDKLCDEEYFNEDVYEEYYGIIESVIEHHSENESGEYDAEK